MKKTLLMPVLMAIFASGCSTTTEQFTLECEEKVYLSDSDTYMHELLVNDDDSVSRSIMVIEKGIPGVLSVHEIQTYVSGVSNPEGAPLVLKRSKAKSGISYQATVKDVAGYPTIETMLDYSKLVEMKSYPDSPVQVPIIYSHASSTKNRLNTGYAELFVTDKRVTQASDSELKPKDHRVILRHKTCAM